jgi:hypothetical protein
MAAHFLLSPLCRTLNVAEVARMSEDEAWMRWTPALRQVAMRESCSYKRPRNRSNNEAVPAEA